MPTGANIFLYCHVPTENLTIKKCGGIFGKMLWLCRICIIGVLLVGVRTEIFDENLVKAEETDVSDQVATESAKMPLSDLPVFHLETLRPHNGTDPFLPILLGLKGVVFDVTSGSKFYAPGKAYANFAGRDVTRNTAMFSTKNRDLDRVDYPPGKQVTLDSKNFYMYSTSARRIQHDVRPDCTVLNHRNLQCHVSQEVPDCRYAHQYQHRASAWNRG